MAETRTYQGHTYTRNGPGEPWTLADPVAPQTFGTPDPAQPYKAPKAAADTKIAEADAAYAERKARAEAIKAEADAADAKNKAARGGNSPESAATRAAALQGYNAARLLSGQIVTMRDKFKAGPGSTSGLAGLEDYLPLPSNQAFDQAANAARGNVGTTLGFTGGQLNTAQEAEMAVGPYLPRSSDYDSNALSKMAQLESLRDKALRQAIQTLGGIPDANGNVTPVPNGVDPVEYAKKSWGASTPATGRGGLPAILPPGGDSGGGGPTPYAGPGPIADLNASGSTGANVVGTGQNAVANPAGEALYRDYLGLWAAKASDDVIRKWSQKVYGTVNPDVEAALQARREGKKINFYPGQGLLTKNVASNGGTLGDIADTSATPLGTFGANFGNSAGAGIPQWLAGKASGNRDLTDIRFDAANARNPNAAILGQLTGGAAGAGIAELGALRAAQAFGRGAQWAPRIADTTYGAVSGATGNPDDPLKGALLGGTLGGVGGAAGRSFTRGVGNAFRGVRDEYVRTLADRGVPMTSGQILGNSGWLGSSIKGIEDRLTGIPVVGDMINARRREGFEGFNRAAFNEARDPIGAPPSPLIREQGVEALGNDIGTGYANTLDGVNVRADNPFVADMTGALRAGAALPEPMAGRAGYTLNTRVGNSFGPNGELSGRDFQQSLRGLRRDARAVRNEPYGWDFGNVTGQAEDALSGLLDRQAPGVVPQYNAANRANTLYETVRSAVDKARNGTRSGETGVFSPSQLSDAASSSARRFGNSQGTTRQPFYDLSRAGQEVLPSNVPDSGTAGRLVVSAALPALLGGGVGMGVDKLAGTDNVGTAGLTLGALLAAGGSRRAQRLFQTLLTERPDALVRIGDQINRRQAIGGLLTAPLALQANR